LPSHFYIIDSLKLILILIDSREECITQHFSFLEGESLENKVNLWDYLVMLLGSIETLYEYLKVSK
jgi:hypothetical protein